MRSHSTKGESTPITKADIKALKTADRIILRYLEKDANWEINPTSYIECVKAQDEKNPWEQYHYIHAASHFDKYDKATGKEVEKAFGLLWRYRSGSWDTVSTAIDCLREGDVLTLKWVIDNNNQYLDGAELHHDCVYLEVERGAKKKMLFYLDSSCCADNSARMVQLRERREGE